MKILLPLKRNGGFWDVLTIEIELSDSNYLENYFIGHDYDQLENKAAIYLADSRKALSITGDTRIEGNVYVPNKTVKRGYVDGLNLTSDKLVYGEIHSSKKELPKIEKIGVQAVLKKSVTSSKNEITQYRSFTDNPVLIKWQSSDVSDFVLKGNYIIQSNRPIFINRTCRFEDIIIVAPSVTLHNGFVGSLQIFAKDTVIVGENVDLLYPSSISIQGSKHAYLKVEDDAKIHGAVYIKPNNPNMNKEHCFISKGAELNGELRVEGVVEFRGGLNGYLSCDQFVYSSASGKYQNYLVNAKISSTNLSKYYLPLLNNGSPNMQLLKRVQ